jgi:DNA-binding response OmpR family regulator
MNQHQGPIRALIADDDPTTLLILKSLVDSLEVETFTATDVAGARTLLNEIVPHIAILDVLLPDGDGIDILLDIRKAHLPTAVALISATLEDFPFHKCESFHPDIIFSKPLDPTAISKWVQEQAANADQRMDKFHIQARLASANPR